MFTCRLGIRETLGQSPLKNVDVLQTLFFFRYIIRWWVKGKPHISFQGYCRSIGYNYFESSNITSVRTPAFSRNMYDKIHCNSMINTCHENWIKTYLVIMERSLKIISTQKLFQLIVVGYVLFNDFRAFYKVIHPKYYKHLREATHPHSPPSWNLFWAL